MSIESGIYAVLRQDAGLAALAGDRVYPGVLPQGERRDCVAWSEISGVRSYTNDGPTGLVTARFQLTYWTATIASRRAGADAIRKALAAVTPATWGDTPVQSCMLLNESDTEDISEIDALKRYGKILDFEVAFVEAAS